MAPPTFNSKQASGPEVRVRLKKKISSISVTGLGLTFQGRRGLKHAISLPQLNKAHITVKRTKLGYLWQVKLAEEKGTLQFKGSELEISGDMVRLGVEPAPTQLVLHAEGKGDIDVVASLDLESYLAGVLPSEMPASWPLEALKAQLVASRSYTLDMLKQRKHWHYHVEASVYDQVYKMLDPRTARKSVREKVKKAIVETRGQHLTQNGRVLRAYYHADCGGQTEDPKYVWNSNVSFGTTKDASCPLSPYGQWDLRIKKKELSDIFSKHFGFSENPNFKSMLIAQRTPSGRVDYLQVLFEGHQPLKLSAQKFRELVGFSRLKSTNFRFFWFGEEMQIDGKGHGHGVGLCQYGSRSLARRGLSYEEILKHYYPKAELKGEAAPILSSSSDSISL